MAESNSSARDRAYRHDLFIAPEWNARFDAIISEHVELPTKGTILEINCGTGARAIEMSESLEEGEVLGVDGNAEALAIARAKAIALEAERCRFTLADAASIDVAADTFDLVIADATLEPPSRLAPIVAEAARVARGGAPVLVKVTLRGSFDEFSSIYWEALHDLDLVEEVWPALETLITARPTLAEALETLDAAGLADVTPHQTKEEFRYDSGSELMTSPLVADLFLDEWLSIVPDAHRGDVRQGIARIIDRERGGFYFDFSVKALLAAAVKPE